MNVSVLMPFGGGHCEWRARAHDYIVRHYTEHHPDWELVEGHSGEPWSKGAALEQAAGQATGDIFVLADADSFVDPDKLRADVAKVADVGGWAMPHQMVYRLSQTATEALYSGERPNLKSLARPAYRGLLGGGLVILRRTDWERLGGVDPRFQGWGGEDQTFGWILRSLINWPHSERADLIHLWHPHPAPDLRGSPESEALVAEYKPIRRDPAALVALIERRRRESHTPPYEDGDRHEVHADRPC